jgi:hypothetical protein
LREIQGRPASQSRLSSFWLSAKAGKEAWVEPVIDGNHYRFEVRTGNPRDKAAVAMDTKLGRGANFRCVLSQSTSVISESTDIPAKGETQC